MHILAHIVGVGMPDLNYGDLVIWYKRESLESITRSLG
jgi:hypothetical protein